MENYLEPIDDGLPMRESGPWAAEKLDYLLRYIDVFETSMREKWKIRNYIDLMSGPGKNYVRDNGETLLGSPLLALTTSHRFTGYFFVEFDQVNVTALTQRCRVSPDFEKTWIRHGDCNVLVDEIVAQLKRDEWRSLNLAFLDPEGLELKWETVARLASVRRMDLIINYPQGGLTRYMKPAFNASGLTRVDDFFGDASWREIYEKWQKQRNFSIHRSLIDLYKTRLQALGYAEVRRDDEVGDEPLMRNAKKRSPLYRLLFASKSELGNQFWRSITRRNLYGQASFF